MKAAIWSGLSFFSIPSIKLWITFNTLTSKIRKAVLLQIEQNNRDIYSFMEQLVHVFETSPEWDEERKYKVNNLNVYFENEKRKNVKVDVSKTLLEILKLDE